MKILTPLPCPCCGHKNPYIGPMSFDSVGVHCHPLMTESEEWAEENSNEGGCGLQIAIGWYNFTGKAKEAKTEALNKSIELWNKRVDTKPNN